MELGPLLTEHPWLTVVFAALVGVAFGITIGVVRWITRRRNRVVPEGASEEPWECVDIVIRCATAVWEAIACGRAPPVMCRTTFSKAIVVVSLALLTHGLDILAVSWASVLHERLGDMQANAVGDMEKKIVDSCMRDFEGLPLSDPKYVESKKHCVEQLEGMDSLRWLPDIRLTVDERVCEPESLCTSGDPRDCLDRGEPLGLDYKPGFVTSCYRLIDRAKAERNYTQRVRLQDEVESQCTGKAVWNGYERHIWLHYCMWKHQSTGVCMNSMRTNCPSDTSCCPTAQNAYYDGVGKHEVRPNQYVCQKSPLIGLYCQHIGFRDMSLEGNFSSPEERPFCNAVTCPSFEWCRDLADIPGTCLGDACQLYRRSVILAVGLVVGASLAIALDLVDWILLLRCPLLQKAKAGLNAAGAALRLMIYCACIAGGLRDFALQAEAKACFNAEGDKLVASLRVSYDTASACFLAAMFCSVFLWYFSTRWGSRLINMPHAKAQYANP